MKSIKIIEGVKDQMLRKLNVFSWPIWEKEASNFDWHYEEKETCYLLEGDVSVFVDGEGEYRFKKGDLVTFKAGLDCKWLIHEDVKKHYSL